MVVDGFELSLTIVRNAFDLLCRIAKEELEFPDLKPTGIYVLESTAQLVELDGKLFPLMFPNEDNLYIYKNEKYVTPYVIVPMTPEGRPKELDLDVLKIVPAYQLAVADELRKYAKQKKEGRKAQTPLAYLNHLFRCQRLHTVTFSKNGSEERSDEDEEEKTGFMFKVFEPYEPLNELEANFLRKKVIYPHEEVAETIRLPHESHRGRVDLFETPESEKIGILLCMCEGATYDPHGLTIRRGSAFSLSTFQIPFLRHSDGARILMGSKNLKQYIPLQNLEEPMLKTPHSLKMGVNALVVYMLYNGLNFEDGIVVSESFAKKMFAIVKEPYEINVRGVLPEDISVQGDQIFFTWKASKAETGSLEEIESVLTIKKSEGERIVKSDVLVVLETRVKVKDVGEFTLRKREYRYEGYYEARILSIKPSRDVLFPQKFESITEFKEKMLNSSESERESYLFEYLKHFETEFNVVFELEVEKPLKVGDKISGRHGNKGVISRILPDEKMPKVLIDGEWTTADVLLSPLSVVSRMNLGQLFETQISLLIKKGLYRDCFDVTETVDEPQRREILEKLKSLGADDLGRFPVRFDDTEIRAVAGYQYMVRLDHCVGDKIHAIGLHAPTSPITFQPFKGRSGNGGQRLGEMEFWTLLDHNAFKTLELFKECNRDSTEDRVTEKLNEFLSHILSRVYGVRYSVNNSQVVFEKGKSTVRDGLTEEQRMFVEGLFHGRRAKERMKKIIFKKEGYVRSVMVGRRLFNSARSVIVPCPELEPDRVLLPAEFGRVFFEKPYATVEQLNALAKFKFVLVNRQPSLHKHNIQAFKFEFWEEWAIGFPILACKGYNADFDGDTVAVYYPTIQHEDELTRMTLKENPFIFGSAELALSIDQDIVHGMSFMGFKNKKEAQKHFKELLLAGEWDRAMDVYRKALELATKNNLTLSIFEIERDSESFAKIKQTECRGSREQYEQLNRNIDYGSLRLKGNFIEGVNLEDYLRYISERARKSLMDKKLHVAEAGDFTRFLVEAAGHVVLGEGEENVLEYSEEFVSKLVQRNLLKNALLWRYDVDLGKYLTEEDLEDIKNRPRRVRIYSPVGGPVTKRSFGLDPSTGKELKIKYIGVACAHSTGERGTQLSMQTFHTGGSGEPFRMSRVRSYIVKSAKESRDFLDFLERLMEPSEADEDARTIIEMLNLKGKSKGIFEYLSVQFSLLEVLYEPLRSFREAISLDRGPLTCMSYERGHEVVKKIRSQLLNSGSLKFFEKHPRAFFFDAFVL